MQKYITAGVQAFVVRATVFSLLIATVMPAPVKRRLASERGGDGGGSALTNVLLAVGGVVAAGAVIGFIIAAINDKADDLTP